MATTETRINVGPVAEVERAQPWPVVLILFGLTALVETIAVSHVFAFLPLYLRLVGMPEAAVPRWTGILLSGVFVFGLPLVPFWGAWADKYGRKLIIVRSALVEAVVALLVVLSQTPWQLGASLFVIGFQLGNTGVMLAALRDVTPAKRVGLAIALLGIAGPVGNALGPAGGGWLVDHTALGLRGLFALDALLSVGSALLLAVAYREVRPSVVPVESVTRLARQSIVSVVKTPISLILFATFSIVLLGRSVVQPFLPLFVERLHPSQIGLTAAIGLVVGSSSLIGVLLSPVAGALGDRFGYRRILGLVTLGIAASLAALPFAPTIAALAVVVAIVGGGVSAFTAMVYALLATLVPEDRRSATLNLAFFPFYVGSILGPIVGALVVGVGLRWVPLVGAVLVATGLLVQRRLPRS
jgi:DHA1 family multidrug resistance protein-like MFS transporter